MTTQHMSPSAKPDVLIIGAGLTGLTAATCLIASGQAVKILEASSTIGGRIQSVTDPTAGSYLGDLGPTWIWPDAQRLAAAWIAKLGLETFRQYDSGEAIVERDQHSAPIRYSLPGMHDSTRIVGGPKAIIDRLAGALPQNTIATNSPATSITITSEGVEVTTSNPDLSKLCAKRVVVAIPLRIAADTISWQLSLPEQLLATMRSTPTWMAAQAKAVAIYDRPFWRENGLSGRLASHVGPLVETHDHSGRDGTPAALFGFIGWPHGMRCKAGDQLNEFVLEQLARCFGEEARQPLNLQIEDWSGNQHICAKLDLSEPPEHPQSVPAIIQQPLGDDQVYFAVAETAPISPGLIEGAFAAGESVAIKITRGAPHAGSHPSG